MLTDNEIVTIARTEVERALGYDSDELATVRESALNYYHGKMASAPEGRSQVVSHDVADVVHATLSQVSRQFQTSTVVFEPNGPDDEDAAQMESDMVRHQIERNNGYKILNSAAFEALLSGNGWIKCQVEEDVDVSNETYPELDPLQLQVVSQPTAPDQVVSVRETKDGFAVRRETTERKLNIEAIQADVMVYSTETGVDDISKLRMVGERLMLTDSELKALGVSDVDMAAIPLMNDDYWPAVEAREGQYQDYTDTEPVQNANRRRECFDVYIRLDMEDNGTTELWRILYGGTTLITKEPAECTPYATGSPVPLPLRVQGTGMYQLFKQVQDAKTHTLRQYMDNLAVMNGSRVAAVEGAVNLDDLTNGRINGVVRVRSPDAVIPLPAADIGGQAITGLNYLDSVRSQRGGASVELGDADRQLMQSSATAAAGAIESAEKMAGWYCSNLVQTLLADTYRVIHKQMRYNMPGTINARIRGKWAETDPAQWQERQHIEVTAGLTSSERREKIQGLTVVIGQLSQMLQSGGEGVITDKSKLFGAMSDWIRMSELGRPEEYLIDPESEEGQQAQQAAQQQAEQARQQQAQERAQILQIEQMKIQQDKYKVDKEVEFKYYDTNVDAGLKEAELTVDAITEREKMDSAERQTVQRPASAGAA